MWLGIGGFDDLAREEQELAGVELFGLPAVDLPKKLLELVLKFFAEMRLLAERRQQLADEPVSGFEIFGKWHVGVDGRHAIHTGYDR